MTPLDFIKNTSMVTSVIFFIQIIKSKVNKAREESGKKPLEEFWLIVVALSGIMVAFVNWSTGAFQDETVVFNVWQFISDAFAYAAASAYVYKNWKALQKIVPKALTDLAKNGKKNETNDDHS